MPSEHIAAIQQQQPDQAQQQIKVCSSCHHPLSVDSPNAPFLLYDGDDANDASIVCVPCRNSLLTHRIETPPVSSRGEFLFAQVERELRRRVAELPDGGNEAHHLLPGSPNPPAQNSDFAQQFSLDEDIEMEHPSASCPQPRATLHPAAARYTLSNSATASGSSTSPRRPLRVVVNHDAVPQPNQTLASSHAAQHTLSPISRASSSRCQPEHTTSYYADPLVDITRLRVRSQGHHCLYPGATFQGTQKSGRNSYDVNVTIVVSLVS